MACAVAGSLSHYSSCYLFSCLFLLLYCKVHVFSLGEANKIKSKIKIKYRVLAYLWYLSGKILQWRGL